MAQSSGESRATLADAFAEWADRAATSLVDLPLVQWLRRVASGQEGLRWEASFYAALLLCFGGQLLRSSGLLRRLGWRRQPSCVTAPGGRGAPRGFGLGLRGDLYLPLC
eukprot:gene9350-1683_t